MNQTNLNSELLAGESRTRKHVPVAVFAVIFIHVVLFLLLLIAAGCRARAKAAQEEAAGATGLAQAVEQSSQPAAAPAALTAPSMEPVIATEPVVEPELSAQPVALTQEEADTPARTETDGMKVYVVKPGDSLWLIARQYNTTVSALKALNNLKTDRLKTGQELKVDSSTSLRAQKT